MDLNFSALRESLIQNLYDFLNTEADLVITFAGLAKHHLETGNSEHYERSKRNTFAALEAIDHFKHRLPPDLRMKIETRRLELAALISTL
jgi:hypothetical protein